MAASSNNPTSLYRRHIDPIKLACYLFLILPILLLCGFILKQVGIYDVQASFGFLISNVTILLYALFCSVLLITTKNVTRFWNRSVIGFILLLLLGMGFSYWYSDYDWALIEPYLRIYMVVSVGFLVFITIMTSVRWIMDKSGNSY